MQKTYLYTIAGYIIIAGVIYYIIITNLIHVIYYIIITGVSYSLFCRVFLYFKKEKSPWLFSPLLLSIYSLSFLIFRHKVLLTLLRSRIRSQKTSIILWELFLSTYAYNLERLYLAIVDSFILILREAIKLFSVFSIFSFEYQIPQLFIIIIDAGLALSLALDVWEFYSEVMR
jgi:hypothetical protein